MKILQVLKNNDYKVPLYFCEYEEGKLETDKLAELVRKNGMEFPEGGKIKQLVVASKDTMGVDRRLVSVGVDTPTEMRFIRLDKPERLDLYLKPPQERKKRGGRA